MTPKYFEALNIKPFLGRGLSTMGGLIGVALGAASVQVIKALTEWNAVITPWALTLSMVISCLTGIIFGIYPARRAAAMDPIPALRHE